MNKVKFVGLITFLGIIIIANFYSGQINYYLEGLMIGKTYHFETESGDFQFTAMPSKGRDTKMMRRQYENHLKKEGTQREEICRTFRGNPFKFWNWYKYATMELYQYKYKKRSKN